LDLTGSRKPREVLEGSGFVPEPPHSLEFRVYMVILEMIFISLATLKAACRNQPSNWFLMIVVGSFECDKKGGKIRTLFPQNCGLWFQTIPPVGIINII
jgi:hypothetical protein